MKTTKIALVAVGVFLLAGCGNGASKEASDQVSQNPEVASEKKNESADSIISSIEDAMTSGETMKCSYVSKSSDGDFEATSYISGEKYLAETSAAGQSGSVLFDGENMYMWSTGQAQGMKMSKACMEELETSSPETSEESLATETQDDPFENATDVSCEKAQDVDFSVPAGVTFADQCEMMKSMQAIIPSSGETPAMPDMSSFDLDALPQGMPTP